MHARLYLYYRIYQTCVPNSANGWAKHMAKTVAVMAALVTCVPHSRSARSPLLPDVSDVC